MTQAMDDRTAARSTARPTAGFAVQDCVQLLGQIVIDATGRRLGVIRAARCDGENPYLASWTIVSLGPWRCRPRLVPLIGAYSDETGMTVPYAKALVRAMPHAHSMDLDDPDMLAAVGQLYRRGRSSACTEAGGHARA